MSEADACRFDHTQYGYNWGASINATPAAPTAIIEAWRGFEVVDPLTQLSMSLVWNEDYSDEYKHQVLREAIEYTVAALSSRPNGGKG